MKKRDIRILTVVILLALVLISGKMTFFSDTSDTSSQTSQETTYDTSSNSESASASASGESYRFRNYDLLDEHFEKHGGDFDYANAAEYEEGASAVVNSPKALHKTEKEDGDDVYYIEDTNEFVILSKSGYIRTYFKPEDGIDYFERQ